MTEPLATESPNEREERCSCCDMELQWRIDPVTGAVQVYCWACEKSGCTEGP